MSWDDVVIGTGNKGNFAVACHRIKRNGQSDTHISQNLVSFWISDLYLGCDITIMKNTPEGLALRTRLESKEHTDVDLGDWLDDIMLSKISKPLLKQRIQEALQNEFVRGGKEQAYAIRQALFCENM